MKKYWEKFLWGIAAGLALSLLILWLSNFGWWKFFWEDFMNSNLVVGLGVGLSGLWLGLHKYKKIRGIEKTEKRYLEKGLEELIDHISMVHILLQRNFWNLATTLRALRDLKEESELIEELKIRAEKEKIHVSPETPVSLLRISKAFSDLSENKNPCLLAANLFVSAASLNDELNIESSYERFSSHLKKGERSEKAEFLRRFYGYYFDKREISHLLISLGGLLDEILCEIEHYDLGGYSDFRDFVAGFKISKKGKEVFSEIEVLKNRYGAVSKLTPTVVMEEFLEKENLTT